MSTEHLGCEAFGVKPGSFPCDADPLQAVAVGIFTGLVALCFSAFLMKNVGRICDQYVTAAIGCFRKFCAFAKYIRNQICIFSSDTILLLFAKYYLASAERKLCHEPSFRPDQVGSPRLSHDRVQIFVCLCRGNRPPTICSQCRPTTDWNPIRGLFLFGSCLVGSFGMGRNGSCHGCQRPNRKRCRQGRTGLCPSGGLYRGSCGWFCGCGTGNIGTLDSLVFLDPGTSRRQSDGNAHLGLGLSSWFWVWCLVHCTIQSCCRWNLHQGCRYW